ncbi:MAG: hypothetical protein ACYSR3_15240 [Planctomycetota bacterium]|jgi:hypothetical protein
MRKISCFLCLMAILVLGISVAYGNDRHLLLDSRIIDSTENAELTIGKVQKSKHNPLFEEDKPWEMRFDNLYANVIYDEQENIYKCWYSPFIIDISSKGMTLQQRKEVEYEPPAREMAICYATSKDGINWVKPDLGLVEYEGTKATNILWRGENKATGEEWEGPHGTGIFKDLHDPDPKRRYKAFLKADILSVAFSPDGIHWNKAITCPEADSAGDTHNNAFWAPTLDKYVGITREWGEPFGRQVARTSSEDFINWTKCEIVLEGLDSNFQTYAMPVFYHGGVLILLSGIAYCLEHRLFQTPMVKKAIMTGAVSMLPPVLYFLKMRFASITAAVTAITTFGATASSAWPHFAPTASQATSKPIQINRLRLQQRP